MKSPLLRRTQRFTLPLMGLTLLAGATSACISNVNEGLNINDMNVTVLVPKTLATSAQGIGVIYVGLYSGVATVIDSAFNIDLALPLPVQAPGSGTSSGETFPYAGTSIGDYLTRDARYICAKTFDSTPVDDGNGHWMLQTQLLQFPFYPGARLWAFSDQATGLPGAGEYHPTCNSSGLGRFDVYQVEVQMASVAPSVLYTSAFDITMAPGTPGGPGGDVNATTPAVFQGVRTESMYTVQGADVGGFLPSAPIGDEVLIDALGKLWPVYRYKSVTNSTGGSLVVTVALPVGDHPPAPALHGPNQPQRIYKADGNFWPYGSQNNDVLNLPQKYMFHGDLLTSTAQAITLSAPADSTITLDMQVP